MSDGAMISAPAFGLVDRLVDQHCHRIVIDDIAGVVEQPVLAVAGIGVERDIGEDADIASAGIADRLDRAAHQIVGIERLGPVVAAAIGLRVGKQRDAGDAQIDRLLRAFGDVVDRPARHARQAGNGFLDPGTIGDEQRPDQIGGRQHGFAVHGAAPAAGACAAQAGGGVACLGHRAAMPHADARCNLSPSSAGRACRSRGSVPAPRLRPQSARAQQARRRVRPS